MIFDNTLLLSDNQAITADAASTNTIDLIATGSPLGGSPIQKDVGRASCVPLAILVTEAFNNITSLQVQVQTSADNATWETIESGRQIPLATLVAGHQVKVIDELPEGTNVRYVRLFYDITGTAPTTGKITAGLVMARQTNYSYGGRS
ncbi:Bbp16 family capsid cement protein [Novosphingobium sp. Leaf2]|uniref:Bbp16 family capsid cement protein n=1 Tax=Novosphingobium sp. Leaf2 TaxID=1735670 RepID=UPI0006FCFD8C|nr:hypothetical protein [Novosphingobium sp. Leaf2]KQM18385.1 hypothetical protein ASE49_09245 [Novosphingobium sp. Leaf2]